MTEETNVSRIVDVDLTVRVVRGFYRNKQSFCPYKLVLSSGLEYYFLQDIECYDSQPYFESSFITLNLNQNNLDNGGEDYE